MAGEGYPRLWSSNSSCGSYRGEISDTVREAVKKDFDPKILRPCPLLNYIYRVKHICNILVFIYWKKSLLTYLWIYIKIEAAMPTIQIATKQPTIRNSVFLLTLYSPSPEEMFWWIFVSTDSCWFPLDLNKNHLTPTNSICCILAPPHWTF